MSWVLGTTKRVVTQKIDQRVKFRLQWELVISLITCLIYLKMLKLERVVNYRIMTRNTFNLLEKCKDYRDSAPLAPSWAGKRCPLRKTHCSRRETRDITISIGKILLWQGTASETLRTLKDKLTQPITKVRTEAPNKILCTFLTHK